ncbi:MAG: carboxypeptidase-like regulatory domain-containing protein [Candidatus Hydrothermarchaeales archaeon]
MFIAYPSYAQQGVPVSFIRHDSFTAAFGAACDWIDKDTPLVCSDLGPIMDTVVSPPWIAESSFTLNAGSVSIELRVKTEPGHFESFGSGVFNDLNDSAVITVGHIWTGFFKPNANQVLISWDLQSLVVFPGSASLISLSLDSSEGAILLFNSDLPSGVELVCVDPCEEYFVHVTVGSGTDLVDSPSFSVTGTIDVRELNDPSCPDVSEICDDGVDNDGDGLVDCDDPDCCPPCSSEICNDDVDNDGDGLVDCQDPDCPPCPPVVVEDCTNGIDDDGDGLVDCNDPDCPPCPPEDCNNGIDDDGDGLVDCQDPDCPPCPPVVEDCTNGIDDDGDGLVDCDDLDCNTDPTCTITACQCPTGSPVGCISGVVTDRSGNPLAGKKVKLKRKRPRPRVKMMIVTDSNGCYQFTDLQDGIYKVKATGRPCRGSAGRRKMDISGGEKHNNVNLRCRR